MHYRSITNGLSQKISIILFTAVWLFLWLAPWQNWLKVNLWIKTGISMICFIIPGAIFYSLLKRDTGSILRTILFGFVFSHLLIALLGLTGRFFHFSFLLIRNIFMLLGLFFISIKFFVIYDSHQQVKIKTKQRVDSRITSYWPLALISVLAALMTIQRVISSDDLAYLAHITNWQHMPALDFADVYFDTDKVESSRFWIASTPFYQAFLTETSEIPGLVLLSGYTEPYLAFIAVLSFYKLARTLKMSHHSAMAAVAIQITFLALFSEYLHPGAPFYSQLSTDKATAAFIVTPIFISSAIQFWKKANGRNAFIFLLIGFSLCFMHPIFSAFAGFIIGAMLLLSTNRYTYKKYIVLLLLTGVALVPQIAIRLIEHEAQFKIPNNIDTIEQIKGIENQIIRLGDSNFYSYNPTVLEMHIPYGNYIPIQPKFLSLAWIVIPVSSFLAAIIGAKSNILKQYILATTSLVALAGIPYTGWILGYFVSAWMLERTTWLYPFGISVVFLLLAFRNNTKLGELLSSWRMQRQGKILVDFTFLSKILIWMISVFLILLSMREQGLPNITRLEKSTSRYQELSLVGLYIDKSTPQPVNVIGSDELNDFLPAISWKAKVISYRPEDVFYPYFYSAEEKTERLSNRQAIFSPQVLQDNKMEVLQKYNIRYILLEKYKFGKLKEMVSTYPTYFRSHFFGRYHLVEVLDISSWRSDEN
jgi:hypothetical protein